MTSLTNISGGVLESEVASNLNLPQTSFLCVSQEAEHERNTVEVHLCLLVSVLQCALSGTDLSPLL